MLVVFAFTLSRQDAVKNQARVYYSITVGNWDQLADCGGNTV